MSASMIDVDPGIIRATETGYVAAIIHPRVGLEIGNSFFDKQLQQMQVVARHLEIDPEAIAKAAEQLHGLYVFDRIVAMESIAILPTAVRLAGIFNTVYEKPPNEAAVVTRLAAMGALLHDIGKQAIGRDLIEKSHRREQWTEEDRRRMECHVDAGARLASEAGLSPSVVSIVQGHHGRQFVSRSYGLNDEALGYAERAARDCVHLADGWGAVLFRELGGGTPYERMAKLEKEISLVFGDYTQGEEWQRNRLVDSVKGFLVGSRVTR